MSEKPMRQCLPRRNEQMGYSLVELMVAVVIALFLLGGMFNVLQGTRNTSNNQSALAQLQDNERMAIGIMTDVIKEAGYYPGAMNKSPTDEFQGAAPFSVPGQVVTGGDNPDGTSFGTTITVGYQPDSTGTVLGCLGSVTPPITNIHTYQFRVKQETVGSSTVNTLECSVDGATPVPLVSDVNSVDFSYGIASGGSNTNTYATATALNSGTASFDWSAVRSVKMTLTFPNPLYGQPGATQSTQSTITFTRVVSIQSKNGVNVN
jgi:type IV pilus assembly protein PilW